MATIVENKDGLVNVSMDENMKDTKNYKVIQYLEDGLSYLNYAKNESNNGTGNSDEDYKIGKAFILNALYEIIQEK